MSRTKILTIYPYYLRVDKDPENLFCPNVQEIMKNHLDHLQKMDVAKRLWSYHGNATGEYIQLLEIIRQKNYYLFGFARLSTHEGPARGNKRGSFTSFNLGNDEGFANLCAALYDPETGAFVAEQAKNTLSADTMLECIQEVLPPSYTNPIYLEAVLKKNVLSQLHAGMIVSRFDFKFSPAGISQTDYDENIALRTAAQFASKDQKKGTIQLILGSQGNDRNMGLSDMGKLLLKGACMIISKYGDHVPISKCEVRVKEEENEALQTLDLLKAREKSCVEVKVGINRIVGLSARYRAIVQTYTKWKNLYFPKINL